MNHKFQTKKLINLLILLTMLTSSVFGSALLVKPMPAKAASIEVPTQDLSGVGSPTIDGQIDEVYGDPIASDPADAPQGNQNLDLLDLYAVQDDNYFYIAFTVNDNIESTNWGKYVLYIDTSNDTNGATNDAWGRNVVVNDPHKPEFGIYSWVDAPPYDPAHTQLVPWDQGTTSWDWGSASQVDEAAMGVGSTSVLEWKLSQTTLGDPETIWIEVWDTGGGGGDNAQDTINNPADDWNATDWGTQAILANSTQFGAPIIDGERDQIWGNPAATDPLGDMSEPNLDLHRMYLVEDADNFFIGFDAYASDWGMTYGIYIDSDLVDGSGGTSDPWGRAVDAVSAHLPEHTIYVFHDGDDTLQDAQLNHWNGSGWSYDTLISQGGAQAYGPGNDWIEYKVPKSTMGDPSNLALEIFTTGGDGHAQDSVPSDPNVNFSDPDWTGLTTTLSAFLIYPPLDLSLSVSTPTEGQTFSIPLIDVIGSVNPSEGVTVTVDLNHTNLYTPTITPSGAFTQPVSLIAGSNTITVTATDGSLIKDVVRNVTYGASQDDDIWWSELGHNSRDGLYRNPGAAVVTGTLVTLRLRAADKDLTGVKMRLYNDRTDTESLIDMTRAASDGTYEYWEHQLNTGSDPTVYWYRFIPMDGSSMAYYEDDNKRTGGWGEAFSESNDNSWQLTVYDPAYQTPDWVKDAVVYQIFPDRFRDGDPANNTPAGTFFYDEETIFRSNMSEWNTQICDPRDNSNPDCYETYSSNFYGGDLQGIIDKLDYIQDLGVTALYLNPIFESPSNHKYDTTDFGVVDDNFGDLILFQTLVNQAQSRGIHIILDGVFNHTSSDSIYFDRYGRYTSMGACESQDSPYRDWYYFIDVTPGTGPCVGSDGTPNGADYESWWGYDSLPKLNSKEPAVRDLVWDDGTNSIGPYWVNQGAGGWRLDVAGDVDPGVISDPTNEYWEGFRAAIHAVDSEGYIAGEEWGNASSWLLGNEWDAVMNYQYSSAMLGFFRDTPFEDNDHNASSSAGIIKPLTPSDLDERLLNWMERYPPEALYAMMNLLGSHDTNRPLFMLDHNAAEGTDDSLLDNPDYDWSDAVSRQKGVAILQMTLPGAPTLYYGDEIGNIGPVTYANGKWEDDPYNRIPFPWLDESGTPFYTFLQSQTNQDAIYDYYALLTEVRNKNQALRTGSFDTLLTDNEHKVYAFGRKLADHSSAAVVTINKTDTPYTVTIDVDGYLPYGASFENIFDNLIYLVDGSGQIEVPVPAMSGTILITTTAMAAPPDAVDDLAVIDERNGEVELDWSAAAGVDSYDIYRSILSGGGYTLLTNISNTVYTDTGLTNAQAYYYVVVSRDDGNGLVSGLSNEAMGIPHHDLSGAWYNLQWPHELTHTISTITPTENIYGQLWIDGATGEGGPASGISAQIGFGLTGSITTTWTWVDMGYDQAAGTNDQYVGNLYPDQVADYEYATRWSSDGGLSWYFSDISGPGDNGNYGLMHVIASSDTISPTAPTNLGVTGTTASSISLVWDANLEEDLAGYAIFRQPAGGNHAPTAFEEIDRVAADKTSYTDTMVQTDESYDYYLKAFDTSFNFSDPSNIASGTAEARIVAVTFQVMVPDYTPGTVYIVGSIPGQPEWNPGSQALTKVDDSTFTVTLNILDGSAIEYKYARGSWDTVEKEIDGNTEISNRTATVSYGTDGTQTIEDTVANWRDPIVVDYSPLDMSTQITVTSLISVQWNQAMPDNSTFEITSTVGTVTGTFGYQASTFTVVYTPTHGLFPDADYTVTVSGKSDVNGDVQQVPVIWTFDTNLPKEDETTIYLPTLYK